VLDETTSAMGDTEALELYRVLAERLPTYTSVLTVAHEASHADKLSQWHGTHYTCDSAAKLWTRSSG